MRISRSVASVRMRSRLMRESPARHLGQAGSGNVGDRGQLSALELHLDELQPLLLVGQGQLDARHVGVAREAGGDLRQVLDDQHDREVAGEELGVARPLHQRGQAEAVLGREVRHLAAGRERLGEVDDQRQRTCRRPGASAGSSRGSAAPGPGRVASPWRSRCRRACRTRTGSRDQVLLRLGRRRSDAAGAVVEEDVVAAAEELVGEERLQRAEGARPPRCCERLQDPAPLPWRRKVLTVFV